MTRNAPFAGQESEEEDEVDADNFTSSPLPGYKIYAVGGMGSGESRQLDTVERLVIQDGSFWWEEIASLSQARVGACAAVIDNTLYVVGGWGPNGHSNTMETLALGEISLGWTVSSIKMPLPLTFAGLATYGERLYVCGGGKPADGAEGDPGANLCSTNITMKLTPGQHWKRLHPMSVPRHGPAVATWVVDGKLGLEQCLVVLGGIDDQGKYLRTAERFDLISERWSALPNLPEPLAAACAVVFRSQVFVLGGCGRDGVTDTCWRLGKAGWTQIPSLGTPRAAFGVVVAGSVVIAIGGSDANEIHLKSTEMLDLSTLNSPNSHWTQGPEMFTARRNLCVAISVEDEEERSLRGSMMRVSTLAASTMGRGTGPFETTNDTFGGFRASTRF